MAFSIGFDDAADVEAMVKAPRESEDMRTIDGLGKLLLDTAANRVEVLLTEQGPEGKRAVFKGRRGKDKERGGFTTGDKVQ
jgi:hypothetical protein